MVKILKIFLCLIILLIIGVFIFTKQSSIADSLLEGNVFAVDTGNEILAIKLPNSNWKSEESVLKIDLILPDASSGVISLMKVKTPGTLARYWQQFSVYADNTCEVKSQTRKVEDLRIGNLSAFMADTYCQKSKTTGLPEYGLFLNIETGQSILTIMRGEVRTPPANNQIWTDWVNLFRSIVVCNRPDSLKDCIAKAH